MHACVFKYTHTHLHLCDVKAQGNYLGGISSDGQKKADKDDSGIHYFFPQRALTAFPEDLDSFSTL